ncbi:MAG TPA: AAA family ATPase, partial [Labilithrix sp.]
ALEVGRIAPEHPIALTTGRVEITGRSAFGDAIGRAVTLSREASASIAMDEASASLLASRFVVAPSRRGTPEKRMYSLIAQRSAPEAARTVRGRVVPLFGRDAELATLLDAWRACLAQSRGAAALVVGGAGAGKTRLAAELVARVRGGDAHVVVARADPLGSGAPYALARAIAASVVDSDLPPPSSRAPRSQPPLGPFIAHLLGRADAYADDEGLRAARVDPALMRDRLREAFASVVGKAFGSRPLLFLIEDLQWADAASVRLLTEIAARATRPLLVLALARPEIEDGAPPFGSGALALHLDALSDDAARALARAVAGDAASHEAIERIVRLGDGNAFFVEELARVASGGTETLPVSVMAVTQARLGALPAYARQVLRAASLLRPWIAKDALVELLGTSAQTGELDATLDDLVAREVLVRAEGGFVFRHELLAEAAYASLTEEDARRGHLATAALLLAKSAHEIADPRLVAEHLERGGDRAGAASAFARAAKAALDGDDAKAALASAERATSLGAEGEALGLALAVQTAALRWRGDLRRAVACGTQALGLLDRASARWLETAADVGASAGSAGDTNALEEVAAQMLAAADATSGWTAAAEAAAWAVRAFAAVAVSLVRTGDVARAGPLLARAEAMRDDLETDHAIADIGLANARAARRNFTGDPLAYLETMPRVIENATHLRDVRTACLARAHLGYGWAAVGAWKDAGATLRAALEEATRSKLVAARTSALHNLALVLEAEGDRDASARMQLAALEESIEQRATRLATACRLDLALVLLRADRARESIEQARLAVESASEAPLRASADAVLALAHAAVGEGREALARAEAAKSAYERMGGVGEHDPVVHLAWARALALTGGDARGAAVHARERLVARAAAIADPRLRASFLDAVPVNAETLRLASE